MVAKCIAKNLLFIHKPTDYAWSYGENDSSPWTPVCTLTSALTNISQLAQRIPGQPGRLSTGCVHRLAGQE